MPLHYLMPITLIGTFYLCIAWFEFQAFYCYFTTMTVGLILLLVDMATWAIRRRTTEDMLHMIGLTLFIVLSTILVLNGPDLR
jgi:hypothetical protein